MAPPQATLNHGQMSPPTKDLTHKVRSGSVQKPTSPPLRSPTMAAALQMGRPFDLPSSQNFTQRPSVLDLTSTPTAPSFTGGRTIQVIVHNPANNNDFTARTAYTGALCRSPYFQQQIRGSTPNDIPILHIVAELEYFDIVANWLCTNNICTRDGSIPDLYTLINVIFLADTLQLSQLCVQVLTMIRTQQYTNNDRKRTLPSYFEIYQKTSVGNPFRHFVAEAYIKSEMGNNRPRVPLVDLPAAMLVDIIILRADCSQKAFEEQLAKREELLKAESDHRFNEREAERIKVYEERLAEAKGDVATFGGVAIELAPASSVSQSPSVQASPSGTIAPALLEELKRTHEKLMEETRKKNDERYNSLVEIMRQRNSEHLEAVQIMERTNQDKDTRLMREIYQLRDFKQQSIMDAQATAEDHGKAVAELSSIIKSKEETEDTLLREISDLKKDREAARASSRPPDSHNVPLLVKNIEELKKTIELLRQANNDLTKANEQLEEDAGRHYSELDELKQVHANAEERNRRQLDSLHKKVDENAKKYRKDIEELQTRRKENSDTYRMEIARLKKANKELLEQLKVDDGDDD